MGAPAGWLDRAIERVAPQWGVRRRVARLQLDSLGGVRNSINDQRARAQAAMNLSAIKETPAHRADLLRRARYLDRTNSWACGVFTTITNNVVGHGIRPESQITKLSGGNKGQPDQAANDAVEDAWKEWAETADITKASSFYEIQHLAYREMWVGGEALVVEHVRPEDKRNVPLGLEVCGSERLANIDRTAENGNAIVQGVEFDQSGSVVAYHLHRTANGGELDEQTVRITADRVAHLYRPSRPGAVRGVSRIGPVASSFEALALYLDHELTRAGIAASFVWHHIKRRGGFQGLKRSDASDYTDDAGNEIANILEGGGLVLNGDEGDQIQAMGPAIQSTAFDPFVVLVLRSIAVGLNVSYELLARDFTKTNFSSARQSSLEDRRHWEPEQQFLNRRLNGWVWRRWVDAARIAKVGPFAVARKVWPVGWLTPGWKWVDPQKEVSSVSAAIGLGLDNPVDAAARVGTDYYENIRKRAAAEKYADDMGVKLLEATIGVPVPVNDGNSQDQTQEDESSAKAPKAVA